MVRLKPLALAGCLGLFVVLSASGCKSIKKYNPFKSDTTQEHSSSEVHVTKITYSSTKRGTTVKVFSNRKFKYTSYKLTDPLRLAVEIPEVQLDFEPKRQEVNEDNVTHISVVRFPKVNSVRVEMELRADVSYKLNQQSDHLEIFLGNLASSGIGGASSGKAANADELEAYRLENERLQQEAARNAALATQMEKENLLLKQQAKEPSVQDNAGGSDSSVTEERIAFLERRLSELQAKLAAGATAVASAPALPTPTGGNAQAKQEIDAMVGSWINAWNRKDIDAYSSFYSPTFASSDMSRDMWLADKRGKFEKAGAIEIRAEEVKVAFNSSGATVIFRQVFRSNAYEDSGLKTLLLTKQGGAWKIESEEWKPL